MIASRRQAPIERAQWLAELALAIGHAEQLAWRLGYAEGNSVDAQALYQRLVTLRRELESLRQGGWAAAPTEFDPFWLRLLPPH
jgi:hypothetical protein